MASDLELAAQGWDDYAATVEQKHAWDMKIGLVPKDDVCHAAATARAAAEAIRMQIATGVAHCACCLKPMSGHRY